MISVEKKPSASRRSQAPLYQVMKTELETSIRTGTFAAGSRVPSESELIATYQVSSTTARRCLDELEQEGLLYRVRGKGTFVSDIAALLQREQVAVLVRDLFSLSHPFIAQVLGAMERITESSSIHLNVQRMPAHEDPELMGRAIVSTLRHQKAEYAFLLSNVPLKAVQALVDAGVKCLGVNTRYQDERIPYIALDFERKMLLAVRALARVGHRRIAFLTQEPPMREQGVCNSSAFIETNWTLLRDEFPDLAPAPQLIEVGYGPLEERLPQALEQTLSVSEPPTAFYCWDELAGLEVVRLLRRRGIAVPEEVSVVGSKLLPSSELAVTESAFVEMATAAAQAMLEWVTLQRRPQNRLFSAGEFLPRETIAAPPSSRS